MKMKKGLLFSVLSLMCVGAVAGCGESEPQYDINTSVISNEMGYITGGGKYSMGATVTIKVFPNLGCSPSELVFSKNEEDLGVKLPFTSITEEYSAYQFAVSGDTIGNYVANFSCAQLSPADDDERVLKHVVTYSMPGIVDVEGNPAILIDNTDNDDGLENNQEKIESGKKITRRNYIDNVDGKIAWYKNSTFTEIYDFNSVVTGDLTLYGKIVDVSDLEVVLEAIDTFKSSNELEIFRDNETAVVIGLGQKDSSKLSVSVSYKTNTSTLTKFVLDKNVYYQYSLGANPAGLKLNTDKIKDSFSVDDIEDITKFIKLKDVVVSTDEDVNEYDIVKVDGLTDEERSVQLDENTTIKCNVYELTHKETGSVMKLFIYNGKVYKVVEGESESFNVIKYYEGKTLIGKTPSNPKNMYLVKVYSSDETLNETLEEINGSFERSLKIIPAYGQTLRNVLEDESGELANILKKYDYSWNEYKNGSCQNTAYNLDEVVNGNVSLCANLKTSNGKVITVNSIYDMINKLHVGGFTINTSLTSFIGDLNSATRVELGENLFGYESKPEGVNDAVWKIIQKLNDLDSFYRFTYDSNSKSYYFYESQSDFVRSKATFVVAVTGSRISEVTYFDEDDGNTYTSSFEYDNVLDKESIDTNVGNVEANYNKPVGSEIVMDDADFYTAVSVAFGDITKVIINDVEYGAETVDFSVGNNNFINKPIFKVINNKLYVASLILKSHAYMVGTGDVVVYIPEYDESVVIQGVNSTELSVAMGNVTTNRYATIESEDDTYTYESFNGLGEVRIEVTNGDDNTFALLTIKRDDKVSYAYTKLDKIDDKYYLVIYPKYKNGEFVAEEETTFVMEVYFAASSGAYGEYVFNVNLLDGVVNSIDENSENLMNKYYGDEPSADFTNVSDEEFYTEIGSLLLDGELVVKSVNGFIDSPIEFEIGENRVSKSPWKVVDDKLYVSSILLKCYMIASQDGKIQINVTMTNGALGGADTVVEKTFEIAVPEVEELVLLEDLEVTATNNTLKESDGEYYFKSTNGNNHIMINFGSDDKYADVGVFVEKTLDVGVFVVETLDVVGGYVTIQSTKLEKIGNNYYLIYYPDKNDGNDYEDLYLNGSVSYNFMTTDGEGGSIIFNLSLNGPVVLDDTDELVETSVSNLVNKYGLEDSTDEFINVTHDEFYVLLSGNYTLDSSLIGGSLIINGKEYFIAADSFVVGDSSISRSVWKIDEGKLYVSSLVLKSHMLNSTDGKIKIELKYENVIEETFVMEVDVVTLNTEAVVDVLGFEGELTEENGEYTFKSTNGNNYIAIDFGTDDRFAEVDAFVVKSGLFDYIEYEYTKLTKIGNNYYLIMKTVELDGDYSESYTAKVNYSFITTEGDCGEFVFNVELSAPVVGE